MFSHSTQIRVRYGETDQMGYLYYGFYALYYEQGRAEAIRSLGFSYRELEGSGIMMPVVEMNAKYLRPALYDDLITVKTILKKLEPDNPLITFHSQLYNQSEKLLNEGFVTLAFYDPKARKKTVMPKKMYVMLQPFF